MRGLGEDAGLGGGGGGRGGEGLGIEVGRAIEGTRLGGKG
jgi:hypothetical protein